MSVTSYIFFLFWGIFVGSISCDILSFNKQYFAVHAKEFGNLNLFGLKVNNGKAEFRSSPVHDLKIRSVNTGHESRPSKDHSSKPTPAKSEIAITKFDFKNTENTDHAFLHWVGDSESQRIFILIVKFDFSEGWIQVEESLLWCSEDGGETFHIRTFLEDTKISFMYTFPSNPRKLVFTDTDNKMIYTTEDELVHNSSYSVPVEPDLIVPHPSNDSKLLLYSYTQQKLYGSEDFGSSWSLVAESVLPEFYWGDADFDSSADIVHLQIEGEKIQDKHHWSVPSQAFYRACLLPGCQHVPGNLDAVGPFVAGTLRVHKEYMFVQMDNQNGSESFLMVSYKRSPFRRAQFPSNDKTNNFLILDLDDGQVFVAVHHGDIVNLYLSDETGQYYVLSLEDVFHEEKLEWFEIDFSEVKGMNWTFMANKLVKPDPSAPRFVQTYVSYDKGGNWAPLFVNRSCSKKEDCSLLLEIKDSFELDPMRSIDTAPGVILAHGLLGQNQQNRFMSVFVSNDGGATWMKAPFNDTCYLRVLNHGSILTAIPDDSNSNKVHYSLNQGKTWQSQQFNEDGLKIQRIESGPGGKSLVLSIFGQEAGDKSWSYVKLDMSTLLPKNCSDDDYETWSPKDYNTGGSKKKCILGRIVEYKRQKPEAVCSNDEDFTPHVVNDSSSACVCTDEDYECDFGFEKAGEVCKKAGWFVDSFVSTECDDGGEYFESQGYRKIPADNCTENEADRSKYDKTKASCPSAAPSGLSLFSELRTIPLGKEMLFYLKQARGSKWDTTYTWDFGDQTDKITVTGFKKASQKHAFHKSGSFNVTVTAKNEKGIGKTTLAVRVQDRLIKLKLSAPWASVVDHDVEIYALPMSNAQLFPTELDHIHYLWSFGDEPLNSRPLLSWNSSMTHSYAKPGMYTIEIEASNSISSISEEISIKIFESAVILKIKFEDNSGLYKLHNSMVISLFTQSIRQQIAQDLGLNRDRLVAKLLDNQSAAYLYLFPTERANEMTVVEIKDKIIDQVKKGLLGFDLFGTHLNSRNLIKIVSAEEVSDLPDKKNKSSPNLTPVFIGAPVLAVVLICSAVAMVIYFRRRRNTSGTRYTLFQAQDDTDTMLDDEDVAPLNMNLDFSGGNGDDSLIDSGGNYLVMETGRGVMEDAAIC